MFINCTYTSSDSDLLINVQTIVRPLKTLNLKITLLATVVRLYYLATIKLCVLIFL